MIGLDSPTWQNLEDAFGAATRVPVILKRLYADPTNESATNEAWSSLCHQDSIYSASIAATPHLVAAIRNHTLRDRLGLLILVGAIAACEAEASASVHGDEDFTRSCAEAGMLLCESICHSNLEENELRHSLSALAGLGGASKLAKLISNLDCFIECPNCGTEIEPMESSLL